MYNTVHQFLYSCLQRYIPRALQSLQFCWNSQEKFVTKMWQGNVTFLLHANLQWPPAYKHIHVKRMTNLWLRGTKGWKKGLVVGVQRTKSSWWGPGFKNKWGLFGLEGGPGDKAQGERGIGWSPWWGPGARSGLQKCKFI